MDSLVSSLLDGQLFRTLGVVCRRFNASRIYPVVYEYLQLVNKKGKQVQNHQQNGNSQNHQNGLERFIPIQNEINVSHSSPGIR